MIDVYEDVLSTDILNDISSMFSDNKEKFTWTTNHLFWPQYLNKYQGTVLILNLTDELKNKIYNHLVGKNIMSKPLATSALLYQWLPGSSISWHDDSRVADQTWLGCTIYLNQTWDADWGGWFCWREIKGADTASMIGPKFNRAVLLRKNVEHHVTITSPIAPPRVTIQLFYRSE
jgi:Rps23 Pro-64 3,4-dihydroxylase Tpa1-like proline 4-hydroxylase